MTPSLFQSLRFSLLCGVAAAATVGLSACTPSPHPEGKPLAALTVDHVQPLMLSVGEVIHSAAPEVKPAADQAVLSFGHDPVVLIQNYAKRRFQAAGGSGKLGIHLEEAKVVFERTEPSNSVTRWSRLDGHDGYVVMVRVRLTSFAQDGREQITTELTLQNGVDLPDRLTLAERDERKQAFMEQFMADLDRRITTTLTSSFYLVAPGGH